MSDGNMLTQEEIDALLKGTNDIYSDELESIDRPPVENYLSFLEKDALGEIGNISFGSSATALSTLLNQKVEITTPNVTVIYEDNLSDEFPQPYVAIHVSYTEGFSGANLLVIKQSDATIIADLMLGGDGRNPQGGLGEIQLSAVQEAMNQMMGSAATSLSTVFTKKIDISPPSINLFDLKEGKGTNEVPLDDVLVKVSFRLKIGDLIDSNIMQLIPANFARDLVNELLNPISFDSQKQPSQVEELKSEPYSSAVKDDYLFTENQQVSQRENYYQDPKDTKAGPQYIGQSTGNFQPPPSHIQPVAFSQFEQGDVSGIETKNLDMLLDIPMQVTVELGRTKRTIKEILELAPGSIIELDKLAGEPVDVLINNKLVAKGEVVVIDENFGVRITDIISQTDRIKKLK